MDRSANRVFISYRRDDAAVTPAGWRKRWKSASATAVSSATCSTSHQARTSSPRFAPAGRRADGAVLIGPRWAGGDAPARRIDDAGDFVRLEVAVALDSGARVVPVLLPAPRCRPRMTCPHR